MRRIATGGRGPLWLRAERQAAGRGRSGRSWSSPAGNLSATLLFEPGCAIEQAHQLSLVTGVAIFDAVVATFAEAGIAAPSGLRVKWPNDLMIGDAKLSGVLIESS
ncbi:MAG: biotin--[acetyl-CoA-carboxylase] ligase, partial [Hyphomicrobiaceae bacterium]|nr:biotin--[acetyl-CoA-carboxylase] ligase [Hyphomicrobiaceae bacterium]